MISSVLMAFFEVVSAFCGLKSTQIEHLSESEIVDDKRDLEKACRCAEIAISCAERYKNEFSKLDRASFLRNVKRFRKLK